MSERWKYQVKHGLFYGILMAVLTALWKLTDNTFKEAFLTWNFLLRVVIFVLVGIFLVGYFNWKEKQKSK
jgi:energy-coupling factor transporter transmembrane protein EcfT